MKTISVNDIMYDPIRNKTLVVYGFTKDEFGQNAVLFEVNMRMTKTELATVWFVFKHFVKVGQV